MSTFTVHFDGLSRLFQCDEYHYQFWRVGRKAGTFESRETIGEWGMQIGTESAHERRQVRFMYLRRLVNFVAGIAIAIATTYLAIAICILIFRLTGSLSDGPMFFDIPTPGYVGLLAFQALCIVIISAGFTVRATFGRKSDIAFLRRKQLTGESN